MLYLVADYTKRFTQYRYSTSVVPTTGGYIHTAPPVWACDLLPPGAGFTVRSVGVEYPAQVLSTAPCSAEYLLPFSERSWEALFPWGFMGTWEEFVLQAPTIFSQHKGLFLGVLSDTATEEINAQQRAKVSADAFALYVTQRTEFSSNQSTLLYNLIAHLREAAWSHNASLEGFIEMPQFFARLIGKDKSFPGEAIFVRFRMTFYETYKTLRRYALQV